MAANRCLRWLDRVQFIQTKAEHKSMASRKRSAVWLYYQNGEDANKVMCLICLDTIQHCGNTSNMLKHLRSKHRAEYADIEAKKKQTETGAEETAYHRAIQQNQHNLNTGDISNSGIPDSNWREMLDSTTGGEQAEGGREEMSAAIFGSGGQAFCPSVPEPKDPSVLWMYHQESQDRSSALCLLCSETVHHRGSTSRLLKHLQERHPADYASVEGKVNSGPWSDAATRAVIECCVKRPSFPDTGGMSAKYPDILEVITGGQSEHDQMRRALKQEARAMERERQLTEQLRRAQEQESRALEQQRALTAQLRRAQEQEMKRTREQEARALERERRAIEQLRRAQEQEAQAIEREREALEHLRRELEQDRRALRRQRETARQAEAVETQGQERETGRVEPLSLMS